jgi:Pyridine nucleotide-disulphide oxidoreductase/Reductase C-terminal
MMGRACTMVMLEDAPLTTHFGPTVAAWVGDQLRSRGVELVCGDPLAGFEGEGRVARAVTESGRAVEAQMAVMGTGAMPDVMLARSAGLDLGETGGIACSATLATSAERVWAAGDACEYDSVVHGRRLRVEHWEVARAQGAAVAHAILGDERAYDEIPYFWSDLAEWCTLEYVGPADTWDREEIRGSVHDGAFSIFYLEAERLVAALTVGRSEDLDRARELMAVDRPVARLGRLAVQDPATIGPALDVAAGDQLPEGGGDRRAAGADHPGQRAVRQAQVDEHAVRHHAAPALGEAPQQREQAVVDAGEVTDRLHDHQPLGAAGRALDELGEDLRPLRGAHGQRVVDDRHAGVGQRAPAQAAREQDLGVAVLPGAQEVARAEELG